MSSLESWKRMYIVGKTQSGKTSLIKFLLRMPNRFIIFDVKREYSDFGTVVRDKNNFLKLIKENVDKIVFQPSRVDIDLFDEVCKIIWENYKNGLFVVDEAHLFAPLNRIPTFFKTIITVMEGELHRVGVWCINQRPQAIDKTVISQSSHTICFKMNSLRDIKAVERIPEDTIRGLDQFCFAWHDDSSDEVLVYNPIRL